MRKMQLGMRREVIKNAENAIENAPGTAPESQKAYKKLISQKFSLFSPFTLDIILDYSIFGPVNERRQQKQNADVAQLDRAFGYEPKGSRFESWHPQKKRLVARLAFSVFVSTRNWNRREPKATGINRSCWREDEPRFSYRHAGSSGLHTAPGSSPGTRRREDQPKGWSSFFFALFVVLKPVGLKDPVISCIAFSSFRTK